MVDAANEVRKKKGRRPIDLNEDTYRTESKMVIFRGENGHFVFEKSENENFKKVVDL